MGYLVLKSSNISKVYYIHWNILQLITIIAKYVFINPVAPLADALTSHFVSSR